MTILEENVKKYYQSGYNCSETLLHACNETYQLDISEEDMKIMAGFGGGMFIGSTCGALVGSIAALSKMVCKTKAHEMLPELRPLIQKHTRNFKELLGNLDCAHIKPVHHSTDPILLNTKINLNTILFIFLFMHLTIGMNIIKYTDLLIRNHDM